MQPKTNPRNLTQSLQDAGCRPDQVIHICPRGYDNEVTWLPIPTTFAADAQTLLDGLDAMDPTNNRSYFVAIADLTPTVRRIIGLWLMDMTPAGLSPRDACGYEAGDIAPRSHGVPGRLWRTWCELVPVQS